MNNLRFGRTSFMIAFCCTYAIVFALNSPLFLYYPLHGDFNWGGKVLKGAGPAMAWYGLMAKAAIVAVVPAICVADRVTGRLFRNYLWVFPVASMVTCIYLLRHFFA